MSFRERAAWISLATTLGVWGFYFSRVTPALLEGRNGAWQMALFVECVLFTLVIRVLLTVASALTAPGEARAVADEREIAIGGRATTIAFGFLLATVTCVACAAPLVIGVHLPIGGVLYEVQPMGADPAVLVANGILLAVVAAELARAGSTVAFHRLAKAV